MRGHGLCKMITLFDAQQRGFRPGFGRNNNDTRPHPAAKLVMRIQINDIINMKVDHDQRKDYVVQQT